MERDSLKDLGIDGRKILNRFYRNRIGGRGLESCRPR
jgi:hypothetical protein